MIPKQALNMFFWIAYLFLSGCLFSVPTRAFVPPPGFVVVHRRHHHCHVSLQSKNNNNNNNNNNDGINEQTLEALQSLAEFHDGAWTGQCKSFAVTADVAAGIVQRVDSPVYSTFTKLGLDVKSRDFSLQETWQWNDCSSSDEQEEEAAATKVSSRTVSLQSSNVDVDAVDASYSLDQTLPALPSALIGTTKLAQFGIEHCLAVSDDCRARCWALYGVDGSLMRVVTSREVRDKPKQEAQQSASEEMSGFTAADLLEMQSDVDRLVDKITGNASSDKPLTPEERLQKLNQRTSGGDNNNSQGGDAIDLTLHPASLLEMSAGVWLGDVVIRDHPQIATTREERGQGFGKDNSNNSSSNNNKAATSTNGRFGEWSVGVQKIAWRWMWNFGQEIRQVNDVGKAMGAELVPSLAASLAGNVCVNEGLSRRIPKDERMVYLDWNAGNDVGFLVGPFSIQVPRYLTFDRRGRPFGTEFAVFQSAPADEEEGQPDDDESVAGLPKLVCSKSTRVYNFEGLLKQGCTSFFSFKRFGEAKE